MPCRPSGAYACTAGSKAFAKADRGHEFDLFTSFEDGEAPPGRRNPRCSHAGRHRQAGLAQCAPDAALREARGGTASGHADIEVPRAIGRRYGWLSGDLNPIHIWDRGARLFGFERAVAHGMWSMARTLAALGPEALAPPVRVHVEFKFPLFLPGDGAARALAARWSPGVRAEERRKRPPAPGGLHAARLSGCFRELMRKMLRAMPGEERAVGLAFAYFFMLMCAYYLLRPLRDAMAISAGLKNLPWLYIGTFVAMLVLTPLFGALVARVRKPLLLPIIYGFFASNLLVFYLLFKAMPDARWLAISFFIWLSAFNMFVVSVFWSFMVDVFRDEEAKRLFGRSPRAAAPAPSSVRCSCNSSRRGSASTPSSASRCCSCSARCPASAASRAGRRPGTASSCCRRRTRTRASAAASCPASCWSSARRTCSGSSR